MKQLSDMNEEELKDLMQYLAENIQQNVSEKTLFCLILFDNIKMTGQYVSNAQRMDIIRAMREFADKLEARLTNERTPH